jgi:hypothetical protein
VCRMPKARCQKPGSIRRMDAQDAAPRALEIDCWVVVEVGSMACGAARNNMAFDTGNYYGRGMSVPP